MEGAVPFLGIDVSSFRYSIFAVHSTEIKGIRERTGRCALSKFADGGRGGRGGG